MTEPIDLTGALAAYYESHADDRGDEAWAHVGDLAFCRLKTWLRRNNEPQIAVADPVMRMKWAIGEAVENHVLEAFAASLAPEWVLRRNVRIAIDPSTMRGRILEETDDVAGDEVIGHLDALLEGAEEAVVLETKSTSFLRGKKPESASAWYIMQAATYAVATDAPRFAVFIVCRESGKVAEFWFDTADYVRDVTRAVGEITMLTGPGSEPPPPAALFGWECKYCPAASCPKNANPANDFIPGLFEDAS